MSDPRSCNQCNATIVGDACSCPCGVFYHPGCLSLAISRSTGKRKCCSHKPSSRGLSPTPPPPEVTLEGIGKILEEHYKVAKKDSEDFITDKLKMVQNDITALDSTMSTFSEKFDNAFNRIENLEKQVQEIRDSGCSSGHIDEGRLSSQCLAEISDRLQRKHNLVLFGCPEVRLEGKANKDEILTLDLIKVNECLKSINPLHNNNDIQIKRIGTYNQNLRNPRPVRITFLEEPKRMETLKSFWSWRGKEQGSSTKLRLSQDRTLLQRKQYREAVKTLLERRSGGEENLVIREIRGEPRIVKKAQTQA